MNFSINNNTLTIFLDGRIDTNTSMKIEEKLFSILDSNPSDYLVLDFEDVEFVSSAGLRVVLRTKKKKANLKIINVVPDVYDVFEMTGFAEMMDIEKGFRKLSLNNAEEIGRGANGVVYRYDDDMIVKVYSENAALEDVRNEIRLSKKAFVSGVSTAIPFDIVKVGPYYGSVFEMIKAESLQKLINQNPDKIDHYIEQIVELLKVLNGTIIKDDSIPTIKDKVIKWLDQIEGEVDPSDLNKLRSMFSEIKEDNNMIHRDFHIKNLLMQQGELMLIDMDTLSRGNIIFELVGIYNAYKGFPSIRDASEKSFLGISDEVSYYIWDKILELYFKDRSKEELNVIENKVALISSVQLLKIHLKRNAGVSVGIEEKIRKIKAKLSTLLLEVDNLNI